MYRIILKASKDWSPEKFREAVRRSTEPVPYDVIGRKQPSAGTSLEIIRLDASDWAGVQDFYDAVLPALGAPDWHGTNVNALVESMVQGDINKVEPPFRIEILNSECCSADIRQELDWTVEGTRSAKAHFATQWGFTPDVNFEVLS